MNKPFEPYDYKKHPQYLEVKDLFEQLEKNGTPVLVVDNGEYQMEVTSLEQGIEEALATDESHIFYKHPEGLFRNFNVERDCKVHMESPKTRWALLVFGNCAGELVADYSCFTEDKEDNMEAFFTKFEEEWENALPGKAIR